MMLPTSYLVEKVQLLNQLAAGFNGRIVEVADWQLATIAETAAAIVVEVNTWRLEPLERPEPPEPLEPLERPDIASR